MIPQERTDQHFQERHQLIMNLQNKRDFQTIFLGDSLTRRWQDFPHLWDRYFQEFYPVNFGVGGDCVENLLWRIENGELDGFKPVCTVLLIGTNNLQYHSNEYIVEGIQACVGVLQEKLPDSNHILSGLLPRDKDEMGNETHERIRNINATLNTYASKVGLGFIDCFDRLLTDQGTFDIQLMPDGLHLGNQGYQVFGPILQHTLKGYFQ